MGKRKIPLFWNLVGNSEEETITYFYLVINADKRELNKIRNRFFKLKGHPFDVDFLKGKVEKLFYELLMFKTYNREMDLDEIRKNYGGRVEKDEKLYERKKSVRLENYVIKRVEEMLDE